MQKFPVTVKKSPDSETLIISSEDIFMMETGGGHHPYKLHTTDGCRYVHLPLESIQEWLFDEGFLLLDGSNLINMNRILHFDYLNGTVELGLESEPCTVKGYVTPVHRDLVHKFLDMQNIIPINDHLQLPDHQTSEVPNKTSSSTEPSLNYSLSFRDTIYDSLTKLPNRYGFQEKLNQVLIQNQNKSCMMALLYINVDRFQIVNKALGNSVGDSLLKAIAKKLNECVSNYASLSRFGGDEFMVYIPEVRHMEEVTSFANQLRLQFKKPLMCGEHQLAITFSIGISFYPNDGLNAETLIKHANIAMYRAKEKGGNTFQIFHPEMNAHTNHLLNMEYHFRQSLEAGDFIVHYQPLYKVKSGRVFGVEALVRWNHPVKGLIPPNDFIPFAEETGLIEPLNKWVLAEACRQMKSWQLAGLNPGTLAVNISASMLQQPGFPAFVQSVLEDSGFSPQSLFLEITESAVFKNIPSAIENVNRLYRVGVRFSIDDFGTGYSSLTHLKKFQLHTLKIDRSFVRDLHKDKRNAVIVKALITLARDMNMNSLAEGVENVKDLEYLQQWGCDEVQGFLFSKPLAVDHFVELIDHSVELDKVSAGIF